MFDRALNKGGIQKPKGRNHNSTNQKKRREARIQKAVAFAEQVEAKRENPTNRMKLKTKKKKLRKLSEPVLPEVSTTESDDEGEHFKFDPECSTFRNCSNPNPTNSRRRH